MSPVIVLLIVGCATENSLQGKEETPGCVESTWYLDADGDGYAGTESQVACEPGPDWLATSDDCDDADAAVHPGAIEICNAVDDDCNTLVDDEPVDALTWYADADGDTYGDADVPVVACLQPDGTVTDTSDCDDANPAIFPGAVEVCNGLDYDCNDLVDDDPVDLSTFYEDADSDDHGNPEVSVTTCFQPDGYVIPADDCDDTDATDWETCDNAPVVHSALCTGGYPLYTYEVGAPVNPELHLVGVYEPQGTAITVDVDRAADVILVVSSYEAIDWTINASSRTNLVEVYVNSYNYGTSTVVAPYGVPTSSGWLRAYAYGWPAVSGGSDTPALVAGIEGMYGVTLTSFTGCYQASSFTLTE